MKILFITVGSEIAPSSRLRVYQYLPYFKKKGIECKIAIHPDPVVYSTEERCRHIERCGIDPSPYDKGFDRLNQNIKRRIKMARRKMILVVETLSSFRYDIVFIQKVILPAYIQRLLYFINGDLIFDFDDAIFVSPPYPAPHLLNRTLGLCRHVIVGSRFLEEYAKAYNKKVTIIPTSIDCERFTSVHIVENRNEKPVVGSVGRDICHSSRS